MKPIVLEKLQWKTLLNKLARYAQTTEGFERCTQLQPNLDHTAIAKRWSEAEPLKNLIRTGYVPPIGETPVLSPIFRALSLGQTLDGESLRNIYVLLQTVKGVQKFTRDFSEKCSTLVRYNSILYPLPRLSLAIEKAISPEGDILDTASPKLLEIRHKKLSLRKTIESSIKQLLSDNELETYLQDKFFTVRSERYVIPIRLDGRGRVKGSIQDTSDSGQTLFIEPESIKGHNDKLLELELNEKLEILRIFRDLSQQASNELETLTGNYDALIDLDELTAQSRLAFEIDACAVHLSQEPCLHLVAARHPLVSHPSGDKVVANTITLNPKQKILIVSGPNAGGKTVVLKTVGIIHLMAKAGLLIPADSSTKVFLPQEIFIEMGDAQSIESNLSTFSGHVLGLKPILEQSSPHDLVLLDELAVGTEPQTGSAIGQAVLEEIARRQATAIVTTHFDNLKGLAIKDNRFRNGSMEFSKSTLKPSYRLTLDIPGQSRGLDVAEQMGLPSKVVDRAKELRGNFTTEFDSVIDDMLAAKEEARKSALEYERLRLDMEAQKGRWEQERDELQKTKAKVSDRIKNMYEAKIEKLKGEFHTSLENFKSSVKKANKDDSLAIRDTALTHKREAETKLAGLEDSLQKLGDEFKIQQEMPGKPANITDLSVGSKVYVVSFQREATVTKVQVDPPQVEVSMGLIKVKPATQDLRILVTPKVKKTKSTKPKPHKPSEQKVPFVVPGLTNSLDLRGHDADRSLEKTWDFIDKAVLRGETSLIIIHGHGTDKLKKTIRTALAKESPYALDFRPGESEEGGDGVTVVHLRV